MASASRLTKTVEKIVTEEVPDGITLTLSENEAEALYTVLCHVGGMPHTSRRGYTGLILKALIYAGVFSSDMDIDDDYDTLNFVDLESDDPRLAELRPLEGKI